jgi:hypothetical protein
VNTDEDFSELAEWIRELAPETAVFVLSDEADADARAGVPDLPTVTISPAPVRFFRPKRGRLLQGHHVAKSFEYRMLARAGVPVPRWVRVLPGTKPNLEGFAEYVVTKPDFGARGADVRLERRDSVEWTPPRTELGVGWGGPFNPRLAQEFVYTGPWPSSHRVATLFGQALFCMKIEAAHAREPLPDRSAFRGQSIVSSGKGCTMSLVRDAAILALAERAHQALPDVPLLGVDIVREEDSGQLFVLELNSIGYTWHFSSPSGRRFQPQFGFRLENQLDGRRKAARILAAACERYAT